MRVRYILRVSSHVSSLANQPVILTDKNMDMQVAMENTKNIAYPAIFDGYFNVSGKTSQTLRSDPITNITAEFDAGQPSGLS